MPIVHQSILCIPKTIRILNLETSKGKDEMTSKQQEMLWLGIYPGYTMPGQQTD